MDRNRIKTYVRGLDEAIGGGIPEGYLVLLSGAPGTMKSSLAFSILYENALRDGRRGAYFSLGQTKDLLLEQMAALGLSDAKALDRLVLLDMGTIRKNLSYLQGRGTWLELFKMYCSNVMKAEALSFLVVDSLDVLETMAKMQDRRSELYFLFEWLRDLGPLTLLVSERPFDSTGAGASHDEAYLADGVLDLDLRPGGPRRLRIAKMRATRHETGPFDLAFRDGGFEMGRPAAEPR